MDGSMEQLFNFIDEVDHVDNIIPDVDIPLPPRRRKIYLRNISHPFTFYNESEFKARYKFTKQTVREVILPEIHDDLKKINNRGLPVTPELQLLIALRFYATGNFQVVSGDLRYLAQPTICRIIKRVSYLLAAKVMKYVHFPSTEDELQLVKQQFEDIGRRGNYPGLKNIIGCIDCSHVKISRPRGIEHSEVYRNRHSWFSINVQTIVGPNRKIYDIVARWPGSSHDSRIFRNSRVHHRLQTNDLNGIILGDSGYAAARFLLTPFIRPRNPPQERYNRAQIGTRNVVERSFGTFKRKFPCLRRGLEYKLKTTCNIIIACAVLHNIAVDTGEDDENVDCTEQRLPRQPPAQVAVPDVRDAAEGLVMRNMIVQRYYT